MHHISKINVGGDIGLATFAVMDRVFLLSMEASIQTVLDGVVSVVAISITCHTSFGSSEVPEFGSFSSAWFC